MREILFRAKAINRVEGREYRTDYKNGDWVHGLISIPYKDIFPSVPMEFRNTNGVSGIEVDYKTVGQFTGLTDKNGKKIFEGDIEKVERDLWHGENKIEREIFNGVVGYDEKHACFCINSKKYNSLTLHRFKGDFQEVIGNIYDNPELLKELQNG